MSGPPSGARISNLLRLGCLSLVLATAVLTGPPGPSATAAPRAFTLHTPGNAARRLSGSVHHHTSARAATQIALPPLRVPTARHPLRILVVGDSLGEDLQFGLWDLLHTERDIRLYEDAVGDTGLADTAYYDWPAHLARELRSVHPGVVIVLVGGNDAVNFNQDGQYVGFGTSLWRRDYGGRVAEMMREATKTGARVLWVGLPIMSQTSVLANRDMRELNAVYRTESLRYRGVSYFSSWPVFESPRGTFTEFLRTRAGTREEVRDNDGVHIAPVAGDELRASAVVLQVDRQERLRICVASSDLWHRYTPPGCPR